MKNKISLVTRLTFMLGIGLFLLQGCKKESTLVVPPSVAHFTNQTGSTYFITAPDVTFKIPVGVSTVSNVDRIVTFTVTSPTGAVAGTDYIIAKNSITIPAGKSIDSIEVKGVYDQYVAGRKDSLIFTIVEPSVTAAPYNSTYTLYMRGPCFDGDVTLSDMGGAYNNSTDPDDPVYTVTVTNLTATSPTTGTGSINNLWAVGGTVTINFDWTDPANITVVIPRQPIGTDYAAGQPISIRTTPGQISTFSVCKQTITLTTDLIVENYFGPGQGALYAGKYVMKILR